MLCSKCKIFSIHLPNYDSYICEFGHILCRTCSDKTYNRCTICDGRIIRQTEFRLEGIPKTIFRQTNEDCMQLSDADSEIKRDIDSDSDENWSRIFEYNDSEVYTNLNVGSSMNNRPENVSSSIGINIMNDLPIKISSRDDLHYQNENRINSNGLTHKKSLCKFKTPSNESIQLQSPTDNITDPRELFMKTMYGEPVHDFDPKKDYFERMAQVNTIHEYYKRPNLLISTKSSSSKMEFKADTCPSDTTTVLQHLSEFREATNYVPPSNVSAYKVKDVATMSEPAIITTSKTKLSRKQKNASPRKPQVVNYIGTKPNTELMYSEGSEMARNKVDVGTMMDICLLPSENTEEYSTGGPKPCISQNAGESNVEKISPETSQLDKKNQPSLHTLLREKLKSEVYSQFDAVPRPPKNSFMVKDDLEYQQNTLPCFAEAQLVPKNSNLTDAINIEVEKAIKNLTSHALPFNGSQRREEIVKQSKNLLRQRIVEEVYSQFGKTESPLKKEEKSHHSNEQINEISRTEFHVESKVGIKVESINSSESPADIQTIISNQAQCVETSSELRGAKTIGISTESYPKLNPELNILIASKDSTQKSPTFNAEESEQDYGKTSFLFNSTASKLVSRTDNMDNEVVNEILEQFQKNVSTAPNPGYNRALQRPDQKGTVHVSADTFFEGYSGSAQDYQKSAMTTNYSFPDSNDESLLHAIPELRPDLHVGLDQQNNQNVYYFQQVPHYTFPLPVPPPPAIVTNIGDDDTNITMKVVARDLIADFREEPINNIENEMLDTNKFIHFIRKKLPNITLKDLKEIILNLPGDNSDEDEIIALDPRLSPPATFRSDYEKVVTKQKTSDKQILDQVGMESDEISLSTIITAWRAFFVPPVDAYSEPTPQFKAISRFDTEVSLVEHLHREVKAAAELNLPRSPVICPISSCRKLIFVSEFSKHIKMDHVKIPVESLTPGRCKNLFLDPRIDSNGINKCHILYLVTDKIRDLGSKEFKDFLPVLVMATKVSLLEMLSSKYHSRNKETLENRQNYLMIWLTGLSPQDLPVYFSLTAWNRFGSKPRCHIVHSGRIYSIRNNQDERSVFKSGHALLLSQNQVRLLTSNGQNMIELQVIVH